MPACPHARMLVCTHARMHACTHARMHACTHARMHVCTYARMHVYARMHASHWLGGGSTESYPPLSTPLSAPLSASPSVPTALGPLAPACSQAKKGWPAGDDPDEVTDLNLLPHEWRWQAGGAQFGAGKGAVRAAPLQRPPATHYSLSASSPHLAGPPLRSAPSHLGEFASLQCLAPTQPPTCPLHPAHATLNANAHMECAAFASVRSGSTTSIPSRSYTPTSTPCSASCARARGPACPRRRRAAAGGTDARKCKLSLLVSCVPARTSGEVKNTLDRKEFVRSAAAHGSARPRSDLQRPHPAAAHAHVWREPWYRADGSGASRDPPPRSCDVV